MSTYQDLDALHGIGKAAPHPKQPNQHGGKIPWRQTTRPTGGALYAKLQRTRMNGTDAYIRVDCCKNGHTSDPCPF